MTLIALAWVRTYPSNIPFIDDWPYIPVITNHEPMTLEWLVAPYDIHRQPLHRLLFVSLVKLTDDFRSVLYFNVIGLSALSAGLMWAARSQRGRASVTDAFFPLIWLNLWMIGFFWFPAYMNYVLPLFLSGIVFAIVVGRGMDPSPRQVVVAGACLVLLPLCNAAGVALALPLAVWLGCCGVLAWRSGAPGGRRSGLAMLTLATFSLVESGAYVYYRPLYGRATQPTLGAVLESLVKMFEPAFGNLDGPRVPYTPWLALGLLLVGGVGFLLAVWRGPPRQRSLALGLLFVTAASLGIALGVAYGRTGLGENYPQFALPTLAALYFLGGITRPAVVGILVQATLFLAAGYAACLNGYEFGIKSPWGPEMQKQVEPFETDLRAGTPLYLLIGRHQHGLFPVASYDATQFAGYQRVLGWHGSLEHYLPMLRDARIGDFRYLGKNPPFQEQKLPLEPTALHNATWQQNTAEATGPDAHVVFTLPEARFVHGVRITYAVTDSLDFPHLRGSWGTEAVPNAGLFISYEFAWGPGTEDGLLPFTFWICDTVQTLRIHLTTPPSGCRIGEIVLLTAKEGPAPASPGVGTGALTPP